MGNRGSGGLRDWGIGALGHWGKDKKIARSNRGSKDSDCHHKIYLIPTKALKSFYDSPPHWQFICSQFSKKSMMRSQNPPPPLQKINNDQSLRSFL